MKKKKSQNGQADTQVTISCKNKALRFVKEKVRININV